MSEFSANSQLAHGVTWTNERNLRSSGGGWLVAGLRTSRVQMNYRIDTSIPHTTERCFEYCTKPGTTLSLLIHFLEDDDTVPAVALDDQD